MTGWAPDMVYLTEMRREIDTHTGPLSRDGGDMVQDLGYKPRPPGDPMWLKIATWILFVVAIAGIPTVLALTSWR